jgi:hypothetical protein
MVAGRVVEKMSRPIWPDPVPVSQMGQQLPDGSVDPAASTDCGEACLSSAITTVTGLPFGAGCIRQALQLPSGDGRTTSDMLARVWRAFGRHAKVGAGDIWKALPSGVTFKRHGMYRLLLGNYDGPYLHWVLAYENDLTDYAVMDPWRGANVVYDLDWLRSVSTGDFVDLL